MNFSLNLLSILFIAAVYIFLILRFYSLAKKLKIKELPKEIIDNLKTRSFPKYYNIFSLILVILSLAVFLGGILTILFISTKLFYDLQKLTFGNDAVYFTSFSHSIFSIVMLFVGIFWWGGLSFFLIWRPLPKNLKDYMRAEKIRKYNMQDDEWSLAKYLCKLGGLLLLVFLPILYLSFNSYVSVSRENITYHPFFSIKPHGYSFDKINQLNVSFSQSSLRRSNSKDINATIKIILRNGEEIDLSAPFFFNSYIDTDDIKELYKTFRDQGAIVNIEKLSPGSIMSIQSFCPDKQKIFYTIFEVDYPVVPHGGCF